MSEVDEVDEVARELVLLLRSLRGLHRSVLDEVGVRLELPAAAVLAALDERGEQRVSTLAEALQQDVSSVSRQVQALEREGWVRRERDPADSRAALLDLTPAGRAVLERVRTARVARLAQLLPGWSPEELRRFADSLRRFRTDVSAPAPEPAALPAALPAASVPAGSQARTQEPALAGRESSP